MLAFKGAPASFPVQRFNRALQQYVVWNSQMKGWTEEYVQREMSGEAYIAVHLRIGSDWVSPTGTILLHGAFNVHVIIGKPISKHTHRSSRLNQTVPSVVHVYFTSHRQECSYQRSHYLWSWEFTMPLQEKACERAVGMESFMESGQCLEDVPGTTITQELCLQSHEQITRHIKTLADSTGVRHVYVASDVDPRLSYIRKKLGTSVSKASCKSGHLCSCITMVRL